MFIVSDDRNYLDPFYSQNIRTNGNQWEFLAFLSVIILFAVWEKVHYSSRMVNYYKVTLQFQIQQIISLIGMPKIAAYYFISCSNLLILIEYRIYRPSTKTIVNELGVLRTRTLTLPSIFATTAWSTTGESGYRDDLTEHV